MYKNVGFTCNAFTSALCRIEIIHLPTRSYDALSLFSFGIPEGYCRGGGGDFLILKLRESSLVRLGRECRDGEDLTEGRKSLLIVSSSRSPP